VVASQLLSSNYITTNAISGLATESFVTGKNYVVRTNADLLYDPINAASTVRSQILGSNYITTTDARAMTNSLASTTYVTSQGYITTSAANAAYDPINAASAVRTQILGSNYIAASAVTNTYELIGVAAAVRSQILSSNYTTTNIITGLASESFVTGKGYVTRTNADLLYDPINAASVVRSQILGSNYIAASAVTNTYELVGAAATVRSQILSSNYVTSAQAQSIQFGTNFIVNSTLQTTAATTNVYNTYEILGCTDTNFNGIYTFIYSSNYVSVVNLVPPTNTFSIFRNYTGKYMIMRNPQFDYPGYGVTAMLQTNVDLYFFENLSSFNGTGWAYANYNDWSQYPVPAALVQYMPSSGRWAFTDGSSVTNIPSMYSKAYTTNASFLFTTNAQGNFYSMDGRLLSNSPAINPYSYPVYHTFGITYTNMDSTPITISEQVVMAATNVNGRVGISANISSIYGTLKNGDVTLPVVILPMTNKVSMPTRTNNTVAGNYYDTLDFTVPGGASYTIQDLSSGSNNFTYVPKAIVTASVPFNETNYNWKGTLSYSISTNFASVTNKAPAGGGTVSLDQVMASGFYGTNCVWNTNSALWNKKGLTSWSPIHTSQLTNLSTDVLVTALTRRHIYSRGHSSGSDGYYSYNVTNGEYYYFYTTNNQMVIRRALNKITRISSGKGDYTITVLDSDLPTTIDTMAQAMQFPMDTNNAFAGTGDFSVKLNYGSAYNHPVTQLGFCQHGYIGFNSGDNNGYGITNFFPHGIYVGGDSGNPNFYVIGNELAMTSGRTTSGYNIFMQQDIDALSATNGMDPALYQPRFVDVSKFAPMTVPADSP